MLSKNKIKLIKSLGSKKARLESGLFVAEGEKIVSEIIDCKVNISHLIATDEWFKKNKKIDIDCEKDRVSQEELTRLSFLKTPQNVLCLVNIPNLVLDLSQIKSSLSLILDNVQDPGNLGTIIRVADWFGIEQIICSLETADVYNPKVVQATMGAIFRVKVHYNDLVKVVPDILSLGLPIYGATLSGENIYKAELSGNGVIIMGNESKGISPILASMVDKQLLIPFFPENKKRSESLNVAIATAIICSEFRKRAF
jgi:RNA methyltransferase, TrmH family